MGILDKLKRQSGWRVIARALEPAFDFAEKILSEMPAGVGHLRSRLVRLRGRKGDLTKRADGDVGKLLRLVVLYLIGAGFVDWLLNATAREFAKDLFPRLLPSYFTPAGYKQELITYVVIVFFIIGIVVLSWLWNYFPRRQLIPRLHPFVLFFAAYAGFVGSPTVLSALFFALALIIVLLFWRAITGDKTTRTAKWSLVWLRVTPFLLGLGCLGCVLLVASVWYPVKIPNDYYELSDQIVLSRSTFNSLFAAADRPISQSDAATCIGRYTIEKNIEGAKEKMKATPDDVTSRLLDFLNAQALPNYKCPLPPQTISPAAYTIWWPIFYKVGYWQVQAGRLLFHHGYLFVPAHHFLVYGLDSAVPYLYGYGNTLFHAALLAVWSPSLTTYFNTLPLAYLLGFIAIALVVFYVTRSNLAALAGFAIAIGASVCMEPAVWRLAAGFSPLRYLGLVLQIAAIFYLFRGNDAKRAYLMLPAAAFSYFWNSEFAILGVLGQLLALFAPSLRLSLIARFSHGIAFAVVFLALALLSFAGGFSGDTLHTVQLGFFNVALPIIPARILTLFCITVSIAAAILLFLAYRFDPRERHARLCVIPVLALLMIKFLYNPAWPHLFYGIVIIAPIILTYYRWTTWMGASGASTIIRRRTIESWVAVILVFTSWVQADDFREQWIEFDKHFFDSFAINRWSTLGENFITTVPERPIAARVNAVKSVLQPEDKVLLLSPFDHLIAFYANPRSYCGHFELFTNLVTQENFADVLRCARTSENLLVIYDKALEITCPEADAAVYNACLGKYGLKKTMHNLVRALEPDLKLVREIGDLKFYRRSAHAAGGS